MDDAYLRRLLDRAGPRPVPGSVSDGASSVGGDRDATWARRKVAGAARYRRDAGGGKPAPIAPRVAAALARAGVDAAGRDEPLATEERLRAAGRALRGGGLYVRGRDAAGRPIVWARSGLIDLRNLGAAGERAWVDAVATLFELCALAGGGGFTRGAAPRVEGDTTRRAPLPPMRRTREDTTRPYARAYDAYRAINGPDHPQTLRVSGNRALCFVNMRDDVKLGAGRGELPAAAAAEARRKLQADAAALYRDTLERMVAKLGPDHRTTKITADDLRYLIDDDAKVRGILGRADTGGRWVRWAG